MWGGEIPFPQCANKIQSQPVLDELNIYVQTSWTCTYTSSYRSWERWTHPGSFLQWNGGRSIVNGGHLLAFNFLWLHCGPAIVRRRMRTTPHESPWSDKDSDTSDMTLPEMSPISAVSLFHSPKSSWKDTWQLVLIWSSEEITPQLAPITWFYCDSFMRQFWLLSDERYYIFNWMKGN